jgi:hypothetical protein
MVAVCRYGGSRADGALRPVSQSKPFCQSKPRLAYVQPLLHRPTIVPISGTGIYTPACTLKFADGDKQGAPIQACLGRAASPLGICLHKPLQVQLVKTVGKSVPPSATRRLQLSFRAGRSWPRSGPAWGGPSSLPWVAYHTVTCSSLGSIGPPPGAAPQRDENFRFVQVVFFPGS